MIDKILLMVKSVSILLIVIFMFLLWRTTSKGIDSLQNELKVEQEAKASLIDRDRQEVLHDILGKYKGAYHDNDSYDYNSINELFK